MTNFQCLRMEIEDIISLACFHISSIFGSDKDVPSQLMAMIICERLSITKLSVFQSRFFECPPRHSNILKLKDYRGQPTDVCTISSMVDMS